MGGLIFLQGCRVLYWIKVNWIKEDGGALEICAQLSAILVSDVFFYVFFKSNT